MLDLLCKLCYNIPMLGDFYKVTKLKTVDEIKESARKEDNASRAKKLLDLGFISGGVFYATVGDSYEGYLNDELFKVDGFISLDDHGRWFKSSHILEIIEESDTIKIVKTKNSIYKLEKK